LNYSNPLSTIYIISESYQNRYKNKKERIAMLSPTGCKVSPSPLLTIPHNMNNFRFVSYLNGTKELITNNDFDTSNVLSSPLHFLSVLNRFCKQALCLVTKNSTLMQTPSLRFSTHLLPIFTAHLQHHNMLCFPNQQWLKADIKR